MKTVLFLLIPILWLACSQSTETAGVVVDTSTLNGEIQGRRIEQLEGNWLYLEEDGFVTDSVLITQNGGFLLDFQTHHSLRIQRDSLWYYAYRILPSDTIKPSVPLRFAFPSYSHWDSLKAPQISTWPAHLSWNEKHQVWTTDSLPPGRHLIEWVWEGAKLQADLILSEAKSSFELLQIAPPIPSGSLRPLDCGFQEFEKFQPQNAGLGCPHAESDAFNKGGISKAQLLNWTNESVEFELTTLSNYGQTYNPYAKLLLEFDPFETPRDLNLFDSLIIIMKLAKEDKIQVRLAHSSAPIGQWYYKEFSGDSLGRYAMPLDTSLFHINSSGPLDLSQIFGLEFRNAFVGSALRAKIISLEFK